MINTFLSYSIIFYFYNFLIAFHILLLPITFYATLCQDVNRENVCKDI